MFWEQVNKFTKCFPQILKEAQRAERGAAFIVNINGKIIPLDRTRSVAGTHACGGAVNRGKDYRNVTGWLTALFTSATVGEQILAVVGV